LEGEHLRLLSSPLGDESEVPVSLIHLIPNSVPTVTTIAGPTPNLARRQVGGPKLQGRVPVSDRAAFQPEPVS
jgi:hypothetical protein